jgi:hypothetical protein
MAVVGGLFVSPKRVSVYDAILPRVTDQVHLGCAEVDPCVPTQLNEEYERTGNMLLY